MSRHIAKPDDQRCTATRSKLKDGSEARCMLPRKHGSIFCHVHHAMQQIRPCNTEHCAEPVERDELEADAARWRYVRDNAKYHNFMTQWSFNTWVNGRTITEVIDGLIAEKTD